MGIRQIKRLGDIGMLIPIEYRPDFKQLIKTIGFLPPVTRLLSDDSGLHNRYGRTRRGYRLNLHQAVTIMPGKTFQICRFRVFAFADRDN
jgi:hypothetical protein